MKMINQHQENLDKQQSYKLPFLASAVFVIVLIVMFGITIYQFQVGINGLIHGQIADVAEQIESITHHFVQSETIDSPGFKALNAKISEQQKTLETLNAKISEQQKTLEQLNQSINDQKNQWALKFPNTNKENSL